MFPQNYSPSCVEHHEGLMSKEHSLENTVITNKYQCKNASLS